MPFLACDVHMAKVGADVIILDIRADEYACLFSRADALTLGPDGELSIPPDLEPAFQEAGLIQAEKPRQARKRLTMPQRVCPLPKIHRTPRLTDILEAWSDAVIFSRRPLADLLVAPRLHGSHRSTPSLIAARFAVALPWTPANGACLQRAFQLRRRLARRGVATDWIFGVRTWPFSAHCWLQINDVVVGDRLERVRAYTPIAVF